MKVAYMAQPHITEQSIKPGQMDKIESVTRLVGMKIKGEKGIEDQESIESSDEAFRTQRVN